MVISHLTVRNKFRSLIKLSSFERVYEYRHYCYWIVVAMCFHECGSLQLRIFVGELAFFSFVYHYCYNFARKILYCGNNSYHNGRSLFQAWATGGWLSDLLWKCCKVFLCISIAAKRSVDELFMQNFHNLSSSSGASPPDPHMCSILGPRWGTFVSRPLTCPPLKKSCRLPWFQAVFECMLNSKRFHIFIQWVIYIFQTQLS